MPKTTNFFTEGIHPVKVKEVEKKVSAKGNTYFAVTFYSNNKTIRMNVLLPDGSRKYNPTSPQAINLEALLNHTLNVGIDPSKDDYAKKLVEGLEHFNTPSVFEEKACKIQVGYPGTHIAWANGKYKLVDKKGEPFLGDTSEYPSREAAQAAFDKMNSSRAEPLKLYSWPEVLKVLAPDTPNLVSKVVKKDVQLNDEEEDEDGDDVGF